MMQNNMVSIRPIPAPYQAMLAICSDLDETPDKDVYFEIMKFLNTTEMTSMGRGVGLEVGNTIYFDMPPDQFSYWNTDDQGREMIRSLIQSGHIDCLHSYGELATTRVHAEHALNELERHNCKLKVWIDHAQAPTNFGPDIMQGQGDVVGSKAYHADLTTEYGINYVWTGRVTSIIGQNVPGSLSGIFKWQHPVLSGKTVIKEAVKGVLAKAGNQKYGMHAGNNLLRNSVLRNGQPVIEFIRCNPHWGGVSCCETANGFGQVVNKATLDELVSKNGVSVLYTHLGKITSRNQMFPEKTKQAFALLKKYMQNKKILITTTHRLLEYCHMLNNIKIIFSDNKKEIRIIIKQSCRQKLSFQGLTIFSNRLFPGRLLHDDEHLTVRSGNLHDSKHFITVDWETLNFPTLL